MNGYLKQSTASQVRTIGPFVDDTDFKTLETALTIANTDIKIKKQGGTAASKNSGGATADSTTGLYHLTWDATDTATVGELSVSVKVAGALVYFCTYVVVEEAVYDAFYAASATGFVSDTTRSSQTSVDTLATYVDTEVASILAKTNNLPSDPASASTISASFGVTNGKIDVVDDFLDTELAAVKAKTDNLPSDPSSASTISTSFAGVNTKLDLIDDFVDSEVSAIKSKTDQLVFTVAGRVDASSSITLSAGDLNSIADGILKRDFSAVSGEAARSLLNAARFLRNKFSIAGTVLTVTKEDDSTPAWVATLATDAAAIPIVGSDPA